MDQNGADADALGGDSDPTQRVRKNIGSETFPCVIAIDGQTPDYRDWNRIGRIAPNLAGSRSTLDRASGNAEISDYQISIANDIGA